VYVVSYYAEALKGNKSRKEKAESWLFANPARSLRARKFSKAE